MHRQLALLPLSGAIGLALAAQTTVVDLVLPNTDETNPFDDVDAVRASVISAAPTATTWALACDPDADAVDCGLAGATATVVAGPSTFRFQMAYSEDSVGSMNEDIDCTVKGLTESAICTGTMSVNMDGESRSTELATTLYGFHLQTYKLTVTAGVEKLTAAPGSSASAAASSTAGRSEATPTAGRSAASQVAGATTLASSRVGSPQATGAVSGSSNSTSGNPPSNAAGGVNARAALLIGAVAGVFSAVLLL